ncbi:dienelactone hydrolase family protein [Streptomyces sp. NPDC047024]|uniref:dienelactone hydrolase family protein n=1 Tax=Streptomyces sp. NPDC047024 TaxID=3155476 RepID=UPI003403A464
MLCLSPSPSTWESSEGAARSLLHGRAQGKAEVPGAPGRASRCGRIPQARHCLCCEQGSPRADLSLRPAHQRLAKRETHPDELRVYEGAPHGFLCEDRPETYDAGAAEDAFGRILGALEGGAGRGVSGRGRPITSG